MVVRAAVHSARTTLSRSSVMPPRVSLSAGLHTYTTIRVGALLGSTSYILAHMASAGVLPDRRDVCVPRPSRPFGVTPHPSEPVLPCWQGMGQEQPAPQVVADQEGEVSLGIAAALRPRLPVAPVFSAYRGHDAARHVHVRCAPRGLHLPPEDGPHQAARPRVGALCAAPRTSPHPRPFARALARAACSSLTASSLCVCGR